MVVEPASSQQGENASRLCCLRWRRATYASLALLLLLVSGLVIDATRSSQRLPMPRKPVNAQEAELFKALVRATPEEILVMRLAAEVNEHYGIASADDEQFFTATKDFRLADGVDDEYSIVIGVPPGIKWLGGPRNNAAMIFGANVRSGRQAAQLGNGYLVYDPLCWERTTFFQEGKESGRPACNDTAPKDIKLPGSSHKHHRLLGTAEADRMAPYGYQTSNPWPDKWPVYESGGDVLLPLPGDSPMPVMLLHNDRGDRLLHAGRLGKGMVAAHDSFGRARSYQVMVDPLYHHPLNPLPAKGDGGLLVCDFMADSAKAEHPGACK